MVTAETADGGRIVVQAWCPGCQEMVMPSDRGKCGWCDRKLMGSVVRKPGAKRRGKPARVTDAQLAAIHKTYVEQGVSVRAIAAHVWEKLGYRSPNACANSLYHLLNARGYPTRTVSEAVTQRNYRNGLSPRDWTERKKRRLDRGLTQKGKARQPRCGRCVRPAMYGKTLCWSHDPDTAAARTARTALMRSRSPLQNRDDLEPAEPLQALLNSYTGTWRDLSRATGVPDFWLSHVAKGKQGRVAVGRADAVRAYLLAEAA